MSRQIHLMPVALAAVLAAGAGLAGLQPAHGAQGSGNPQLGATPSTNLTATAESTVQVSGKDYLVPPHAAGTPVSGGIYVFFGWVDSTKKWGPSARNVNNTDGNFGTTYLYPGGQGGQNGENESAGIGMVAFTEEVSAGEAPPYFMSDAGDWSMPIKVPGSTFTTEIPGGGTKTTDCLKVACGIFTIGAHGRASATNEKFFPVQFAGAQAAATPTPKPTPKPTVSANSTSDPDAPGDDDDSGSGPVVSPLPKTGIDESSASVVRPLTPLDGQTVAIGVSDVQDSGTGGGLALFGVAALVALVMALTVSLFLRFRRDEPRS